MSKIMNESERIELKEFYKILQKLPAKERERLIWFGQGMAFASGVSNGKRQK